MGSDPAETPATAHLGRHSLDTVQASNTHKQNDENSHHPWVGVPSGGGGHGAHMLYFTSAHTRVHVPDGTKSLTQQACFLKSNLLSYPRILLTKQNQLLLVSPLLYFFLYVQNHKCTEIHLCTKMVTNYVNNSATCFC